MTRKEFIAALCDSGVTVPVKVRFFARSPWQVARYKPEFVGWEAWVYPKGSALGHVVTRDDWEGMGDDRKAFVDCLNN